MSSFAIRYKDRIHPLYIDSEKYNVVDTYMQNRFPENVILSIGNFNSFVKTDFAKSLTQNYKSLALPPDVSINFSIKMSQWQYMWESAELWQRSAYQSKQVGMLVLDKYDIKSSEITFAQGECFHKDPETHMITNVTGMVELVSKINELMHHYVMYIYDLDLYILDVTNIIFQNNKLLNLKSNISCLIPINIQDSLSIKYDIITSIKNNSRGNFKYYHLTSNQQNMEIAFTWSNGYINLSMDERYKSFRKFLDVFDGGLLNLHVEADIMTITISNDNIKKFNLLVAKNDEFMKHISDPYLDISIYAAS